MEKVRHSINEGNIVWSKSHFKLFFFFTQNFLKFLHSFNMEEEGRRRSDDEYTEDGTVDLKGKPILKSKTGRWKACSFVVGIFLSIFLIFLFKITFFIFRFFHVILAYTKFLFDFSLK